MAKLVMFFPKLSSEVTYTGVPLGLLMASMLVDQAGHEIKIIGEQYYADPLDQLKKQIGDASLVGISAMTGYQLKEAIEASRIVKNLRPGLPVVWGGWHPTVCPEEVLVQEYVDFVVRGQGEETLLELTNAILLGKDQYDTIPGLCFKRHGQMFISPSRPLKWLDNWPRIPYHLVDVSRNLEVTEFGNRVVDFFSSYGCPYRCAFCAENIFSNQRWCGMSAETTVAQIRRLQELYQIDGVRFRDNNFFVSKRRALAIARGLLTLQQKIHWGQANGRTNTLLRYTDEEWGLLVESGLTSILIGAESGSPEALELIKKKASVEQTIQLAEVAARHKVAIWFSMFTGYPWIQHPERDLDWVRRKNAEDFWRTVSLLKTLIKRHSSNRYLLFNFAPYPGTPFFEYSQKLGFKGPESLEQWAQYDLDTDHTGFSPLSIIEKVDLLQNYMLPIMSGTKKTIAGGVQNRVTRSLALWAIRFFENLAWLRWRYGWLNKSFDYDIYRKLRRFYDKVSPK